MKIGLALGWINIVILGIIFLFVLEPISLFMKLMGYDPLRIKRVIEKLIKKIKKIIKLI